MKLMGGVGGLSLLHDGIIHDPYTEPVAEFSKTELFPAISGHISNQRFGSESYDLLFPYT